MNSELYISEASEFFGCLLPLVEREDVTDIDYNGKSLWITLSCNDRYEEKDIYLDDNFVNSFSKRVANQVSKPFNKMYPVLEAETSNLRITFVHESVSKNGHGFCIRKSLPKVRLDCESVLREHYTTKECLAFLINCIKAGMNMVFCGEPGVGKTEACKFFSQFIPGDRRVITIEDNPEWHYSDINPKADCLELKVSQDFDYTRAIKTSLRLNPKWLMLSEARSTEVAYLIQCLSTGVSGLTTLHTDDVLKIPDRIVNMAPKDMDRDRLENDIYSFIDVGILIRRGEIVEDGCHKTIRYIDSIALFDRSNGKNSAYMVLDNKNLNMDLPKTYQERFSLSGVDKPFSMPSEEPKDHILKDKPAEIRRRGGTYIGEKKIISGT